MHGGKHGTVSASGWLNAPAPQAWLLLALVCGSVFGITAWRLHNAYQLELAEAHTTTANLARSLADQASVTVGGADIVLAGMAERLQSDGVGDVTLARMQKFLVLRVAAIPTIHHLVVVSEAGDALISSIDPTPPINLADRAYFAFHRDQPGLGPMVGPPVRNRGDGKWSMTVSRRFNRPGGAFGGVVVAVIDCAMFLDFYASFDVGAQGTITLLNDTDAIVVRYPEPADPNYRARALSQEFWNQRSVGNGRLVSALDGTPRLYSSGVAKGVPLLVVVALAESDVLARWSRDAWIALAAALAISTAVLLLGWRLTDQIRQREKREAEVRKSEQRYRRLADYSTDVIIEFDVSGRRKYVSPACERLVGYRPDELLEGKSSDLTHPEDWPALQANLAETRRSGFAPPCLYRVRRKTGEYTWVEGQSQLLEGTQSLVLTVRDAALRRKAEELLIQSNHDLVGVNADLERLTLGLTRARDQAERASQAKSRFLAGMSHELRTPLNGILGYAQLLRMEANLEPKHAGRVDAMLEAGKHLLLTINEVLDLSEIETGYVELRLDRVEPRSLAQACLDVVRPSAEAKGLRLSFIAAPDVPDLVTTDATRLRQVLLNLLGNAVKFTTAGLVDLHVGLTPDGTRLHFAVIDTGPGIPAAHRDRLFQEFERMDADADAELEGAGLGLALSARITELLGGTLRHRDNPIGGSVFSLELPLGADAASTPSASAPGAAVGERPSQRPFHVLVVDDQAMNRDIASAFLRHSGHFVVCADDATAAIAAAAAEDFDVILMDVRMPGIDGLEATRRIRKLPGRRGMVPIVALTAQAFAEQIQECLRAGMNSHLGKPFTPDALLEAVKRAADAALDKRRGEQRSAQQHPEELQPAGRYPQAVTGSIGFDGQLLAR